MPLVSFTVECTSTRLGEQLSVVGSAAALGSWAPELSRAVLSTSPEDFPHWRSEWLAIPSSSTPVEYKYVVCSSTGEVRWESRTNRVMDLSTSSLPDDRLEVRDKFGNQEPAELATNAKATATPVPKPPRTESKAVPQKKQVYVAAPEGEGNEGLPPAIPSWDSGVSTAATVGDLGRLVSVLDVEADSDCGREEEATSLDKGASAASAGEEVATESTAGAEETPEFARTFEDGFELRRMLGDGAFGIVHSCVSRHTHREYAVKVVKKENMHPLDRASLECEIELQKGLPAHENIVRLHASFEDAEAVKLVMDLCPGGDLYIHLDDMKQCSRWRGGDLALSDRAAAKVGRQLLCAVAFLHANGIVHRDIKPENVLLANPAKQVRLESPAAVVKLCDFGYAVRFRPDEPPALHELVGSPDYLAPEVARREAYGCAVDVWSVGALLFECLRGRAPFAADAERETIRRIREMEFTFDGEWSRVSAGAKGCVEQLLVEQAHRPSAAEALGHAWLIGA